MCRLLRIARILALLVAASTALAADDGLGAISVPGATLRCGFVPDRPELVLGLPPRMKFVVRNDGPGEFQFTFGGDYRGVGRHDRFKISVTNAAGEPLPDPHANAPRFGGMLFPRNLKPGESFVEPIDLLAFRTVDKPGVYQVAADFAFEKWDPGRSEVIATVSSRFALVVLPRTPQNIASALDALAGEVPAAPPSGREQLLADLVTLGGQDAAPRLIALTRSTPDARQIIFNALAQVPGAAATDALTSALKDTDTQVRVAAATALGACSAPVAIDALLAAAGDDEMPVRVAALVSLGRIKSDRALPLLSQSLGDPQPSIADAAVDGLACNGGAEAMAILEHRLGSADLHQRYVIACRITDLAHREIDAEWFVPILLMRDRSQEWYDSITRVRTYGGKKAIATLLGCVDFTQPWSSRNWWLLEAVKACDNAPDVDYAYDPNREGTPAEIEKNMAMLAKLKPMAAVFTWAEARLSESPSAPVPMLVCDPPIDFTPSLTDAAGTGHRIICGFYSGVLRRNGSQYVYVPDQAYKPIYDRAEKLNDLIANPNSRPDLKLTAEQIRRLKTLTPPGRFSDDNRWHMLHWNYIEAPPGPVQDRAKQELLNAVQTWVQDYHRAVRDFVAEGQKILSPDQLLALDAG